MRGLFPFHWRLKRLTFILLLALVLVIISSFGFAYIDSQHHQTFVLPGPTGSYAVGRMEYDWIDQSRVDLLAPNAGTKRELVVWVWYPAQRVPTAKIAPYLPQKWYQLSEQVYNSESIQTNSIDRAPLAPDGVHYPVLIFEPGMGNLPTQYTTLMEDLASRGYVIFGITPTYSSNVVVFPDGRVVNATSAGKLKDIKDSQMAANRLIEIWSQDVIFVMNQLDRLNTTPGNQWSQHLDLTRLGVFGHSFGGATAAEVCLIDARCKAGINLDGNLAGNVVQRGLKSPFMVIQHDMGSCSDNDCRSFQHDIHSILHTIPEGASYNLSVQSTEHFNFADFAVLPEAEDLRLLSLLGSINGERGLDITRAYVGAFFDRYLNKVSSPLLQGPLNTYPEVQFITP